MLAGLMLVLAAGEATVVGSYATLVNTRTRSVRRGPGAVSATEIPAHKGHYLPYGQLVWDLPVKHLAGTGIECVGDGVDLFGFVRAEVCAFREVLAQQPVGVFVGGALPRAVRITEVVVVKT
jgi:hypothetical protein